MKKKVLIASLVGMMSISCVFSSYAQVNLKKTYTEDISTNEMIKTSYKTVNQPRGQYISTASLRISNPENGEIGVLAMTIAHQEADEMSFHIELDRWIESEERWANVAGYDFVYNKENCPDEDLSEKSISFNIIGQPSNCYYRLRAVHKVTVGDKQETLRTETDGILITKQ